MKKNNLSQIDIDDTAEFIKCLCAACEQYFEYCQQEHSPKD